MKNHKKLVIHLSDNSAPGRRWGYILDKKGQIVGDAHDSTYGGSAFAVHTKNWAGYVSLNEIRLVLPK